MTKKQEREKWQAQDDAYTIARYGEIMADKARASRAIKAAKAQAEEMQKQATAMSNAANISRGKVVYNSKK